MNYVEKIDFDETLKCKECGATLHFQPGTHNLKCEYCGGSNAINTSFEKNAQSVEYASFLKTISGLPLNNNIKIVKCTSCGSETNFKSNIAAGKCAFCSSPLIVGLGKSKNTLKPHYILPFILDEKEAGKKFRNWLTGLWFAPNDLIKEVKSNKSLKGIYLPYWLYNCNTQTHYTADRGEYYYADETYSRNINGKDTNQTNRIRHTRWRYRSGKVFHDFNNITVPASKSLPPQILDALGPWKFKELMAYDERYLSGLSAETYQVRPDDGLVAAKQIMSLAIDRAVRSDIGGDEQKIRNTYTQYGNITIKYVLLPVWISAYNYNNKVFQFIVNASTGEVIGKRPYSQKKITFGILLGALLTLAFVLFIAYVKARM